MKSAKLSVAERLLAGPPPRPRPVWRFELVTRERRHQSRSQFESHGLSLWFLGRGGFDRRDYMYLIDLDRELRRRSVLDPVGLLVELAAQLEVRPIDVELRLFELRWPRKPAGLCSACWTAGRRSLGAVFLAQEVYASGQVHTYQVEACPEHLEAFPPQHRSKLVPLP